MNPKMVLAALVLQLGIMLLPGVFCAIFRKYVTPKEGTLSECPLEDGSSLPLGRSMPTQKFCGRQLCDRWERKLYLQTHTCGGNNVRLPDDSCTFITDNTKPYPNCCPKPRCPNFWRRKN